MIYLTLKQSSSFLLVLLLFLFLSLQALRNQTSSGADRRRKRFVSFELCRRFLWSVIGYNVAVTKCAAA
ncbi:uncharacterized protein RSE6_08803 [Rhynchosporium secalis]|uniref:Secreted protein n=1 Tax=Rhynchosporium secalis TaxID=38038 RepID=A0A1E1MGC8_RHYSE|nr:uncharacterized protein RSE6_08803 [Rhynchosporium secalis]